MEDLISAVAENDVHGWLGHHGFEIELTDGNCFAYFLGYDGGQGGPSFEYHSLFGSRSELLDYVEAQPMAYLEVAR